MVTNRFLRPFAFVIALMAVVPSLPVHAQDAQTALDRMWAAYRAIDALHVSVKWTAKYSGGISADDVPLPGPDAMELRLQRPNKLFLAAVSSRFGKPATFQIVSDGSSLWYWRSWTNTYMQMKAPATLSEIARLLPDDAIGVSDGSTWEILNIFEWDALTATAPPPSVTNVRGVRLAMNTEALGNARVNVVRMIQELDPAPITVEQHFYIDPETQIVRGLGMLTRGKHPESGRDFAVDARGAYGVYTTNPTFDASDFAFVAPRGSKPAAVR